MVITNFCENIRPMSLMFFGKVQITKDPGSVGVNKLRAVFMHNSDNGFWITFLDKVNKLPQSIN